MERFVIRRSRVVVVICPHLGETVRGIDPVVPTVLIENAPGSGDSPVEGTGASIRGMLGFDAGTPMVLYTGTFEAYQGLDLLFASAARVKAARPDVRFVLAGGRPEQIEAARRDAARAGVDDVVIFAGQRPAEEIPAYLDAADVLVSPRSTGTNTPLKIYQYLRSGCPIVATRLLTHTQVLDDSVSFLTAPTAEGFANGILAALADPLKARAVGDTGASARRSEIQLRVVPGAHAARLRAPERRRHGAGRRRRRVSAPRTDHYSYSVYADPAMAESFEGLRFSGPIGRLIAESQERVLAAFLAPVKGRTVLDVGTGTGRAAIALARRGASVTGVDASKEMLDVARVRATEAHVTVTFASGDAHGLAFDEPVVRRRGVSAGADAHSRLAAVAGRAVPRRSQSSGLRLSGARKRGCASGADAARCRRRWRPRRGLPCLQRSGRARDASCAGVPGDRERHGSSCCQSRCTRRSALWP